MTRGRTPESWTLKYRKSQSEWMHQHKPWESSTGPGTARGKTKSAMRGLRHGRCSAIVRNAAGLTHTLHRLEKELLAK